MIKDGKYLQKFQEEFILANETDLIKNLTLLESMYDLARELKVFPLIDPMTGIDKDFEIARILNRLPWDRHV